MSDTEVWRPVSGYENRYEVSNEGRVKSLPSRQRGRVLKPGKQSKGYLVVVLYDGSSPKQPKSFTVHALVAAAFLDPPPTPDHQVNHIDGDKDNNRATNLEWVTCQENIQHAFDEGLRQNKLGENSHNARFTPEEVRFIREHAAAYASLVALGRQFGVCARTIRNVRDRKTYANVA